MKRWQLMGLFLIAGTVASAQDAEPPPAEETPVVVEEEIILPDAMTEDEMDAEIERLENALDEPEEVKEFVPNKPISADLPVSLPSDI